MGAYRNTHGRVVYTRDPRKAEPMREMVHEHWELRGIRRDGLGPVLYWCADAHGDDFWSESRGNETEYKDRPQPNHWVMPHAVAELPETHSLRIVHVRRYRVRP